MFLVFPGGVVLFPTCQVRVVRFYQSFFPVLLFFCSFLGALLAPKRKCQIAMGTTGPDRNGHYRAPTRSQWALPGPNSKCQIEWAPPGPNSKCQIAMGTTGPQQQVPDRNGHYRAPTASARSQWALPGPNSKCQIAMGTTGPQQQVPDRNGHYRVATASARSQWTLLDTKRKIVNRKVHDHGHMLPTMA